MRRNLILIALCFVGSCAASYLIVGYLVSSVGISVDSRPRTSDGVPVIDPRYPCGPTCLALASRLCGRNLSLEQIANEVSPDRLGRTSIAELMAACKTLELSSAGVQIDPARVTKLDLPVILHTHYEHFVVAVAKPDGQILLLDPPSEPREVGGAELRRICTGRSIIVGSETKAVSEALAQLGLPTPPSQ